MAICKICSSAIQQLQPLDWPNGENETVSVKYPIFNNARFRRCWICLRFSQWMKAEQPKLFRKWRRQKLGVQFKAVARLGFQEQQEDVQLPLFLELSPPSQGKYPNSCEIELNFISGKEFCGLPITESNSRTGGDIDFGIIDRWMKLCGSHHEKCREKNESWYPTRLLHIQRQGQEVRLIISNVDPPTGPYMTLSYRWGSQQYTKLTPSSINQLQSAIEVSNLPQVFQDTIRIADHLDVHYLWIDALCIVQDEKNPSDWEKECQVMDKIYSCAILNVSATMARSGSEPLFGESSISPFELSEIELSQNHQLQKYHILDGNFWNDEITNAPLYERGWVYQERILARRVLHFSERQMAWECNELSATEMFPEGLPRATTQSLSKQHVRKRIEELTVQPQPSNLSQSPDLGFVHLWHEMVSDYSKCKFTYSKDKLAALVGVANWLMKAMDGNQYSAGMWSKTGIYDLTWWRYSADREALPLSKTSSRAPSWSWASVDGEINFPPIFGGVQTNFVDSLELLESPSVPPLGMAIGKGPSLPTRQSIRIKGNLLRLKLRLSSDDITSFTIAGFRFYEDDDVGQGSSIDLEISGLQELSGLIDRGRLSLLPLFATSYHLSGIVVEKIRGVCSYRRTGAVKIPIMINEQVRDQSERRESDTEQKSSGRVSARNWVRIPQRSNTSTNEANTHYLCSLPAVNLYYHIKALENSRRIIDLY